MEDLLALDACRPRSRTRLPLRALLNSSPLLHEAWLSLLALHPDRTFVTYILEGIQRGFRIGFEYRSHRCRPVKKNMRSASQFPQVVTKYLDTECELGRVIALDNETSQEVQTSPFGVIPKRGKPNDGRLILDLSSPHGQSVNDGIDPEKCSLRYASIDQAIHLCRSMGDAPLLSKLDIKSAYRIVPVHPDDRHLLGMHWQGTTYIDTALPFGLRSEPKVFSAVADALLWAMHQEGVTHGLHYLDDFLFVDRASTKVGESQLQRALHTCQVLGVPVAPDKIQQLTNVLTFLGIEIDTTLLQLRLPRPKLLELRHTLERWRNRISCTKCDMLSLVGKLQHVAAVVKPGRTFLRRLIDRSTSVKRLHHHFHLNNSARADIEWWYAFIKEWNGISYLPPAEPQHSVESDAAGSIGAAAVWDHQWLQFIWPDSWQGVNIAVKEHTPSCSSMGQGMVRTSS